MMTNTPELTEALIEFKNKLQKDMFNRDKGFTLPDIKSARILPLFYESKYEEDK